jgi:hypothetical protein
MKTNPLGCVLGLALVGASIGARAGALEDACDLVHRKLSSVPSKSLKRSMGDFERDGQSYRGCIVRLDGTTKTITDAHYPAPLFYPSEGSSLYKDGWRADREADGPDGTAFRISKQDLFCLVEGSWDGGDDSDPKYVPSTRYKIEVMCGSNK